MYLYFSIIMCHTGLPVHALPLTVSSKHSAFLALQFIDKCPPAASFKICKRLVKANEIAELLNGV